MKNSIIIKTIFILLVLFLNIILAQDIAVEYWPLTPLHIFV